LQFDQQRCVSRRHGLFFTAVKLFNGVGGICYTPAKEIPAVVCCPSSAGRMRISR
jgi:hypothetical protein